MMQLLALAISVSAIALVYARWEYRQRGKLSPIGLLLLCAMLLVPNLMLHYVIAYDMPDSPLDYAGLAVGTAGTVLCLVSIIFFRSPLKMLCLVPGELTLSGPYKWSRNPQYVGYFLFLLGFALNNWSVWALVVLVVVAASLHVLVLVEEEHLRRVFGDRYAEFCRRVRRYG
jgi:protein-S-isoprenylcysteine O-methyltransferase Ste14